MRSPRTQNKSLIDYKELICKKTVRYNCMYDGYEFKSYFIRDSKIPFIRAFERSEAPKTTKFPNTQYAREFSSRLRDFFKSRKRNT